MAPTATVVNGGERTRSLNDSAVRDSRAAVRLRGALRRLRSALCLADRFHPRVDEDEARRLVVYRHTDRRLIAQHVDEAW